MSLLDGSPHWQNPTQHRRRIIRVMLFVILAFLAVLIGVWFWLTQPLISSTSPNANRFVDPTRLESHVRKLSVDFTPRDADHLENLDKVAEYIKEQFQHAAARVVIQPYRLEGQSFRNVSAHFGPETAERIVIGAHYDTAGPLPGADDNASGVAGLLELAHLLSKEQLKTHVELVAFTLEEPPFFRTNGMGSAIHADSLRKENVKVKLMISLEMIGYFSDAPNSQRFPAGILSAFYPSTGNYIAVVGRMSEGLAVRRLKSTMRATTPLPVYSISAPSIIPAIDFSDQLNYWNAGYSAVMITDTAFYRNRNYHTVNDTPETLDYERMAMVVEGVFKSVLEIAR